MGNTANSCLCLRDDDVISQESLDPLVSSRGNNTSKGQLHLMWKKGRPPPTSSSQSSAERFQDAHVHQPTRLLIRKHAPGGDSGETHIYAVRKMQEQRPILIMEQEVLGEMHPETLQKQQESLQQQEQQPLSPAELFTPQAMAPTPSLTVPDWVTVSEELNIYVVDSGLTPSECNELVSLTESVCRGQYAAYTYAKQTLGCRDYSQLAQACFPAVHRVVHAIQNEKSSNLPLKLDEREPHVVKYDISRKERQKLDMHTDKSEWTFLISLSDGCGLDYEGGGTYFEALQATVHVQRGHALVFPGKLRHCGQRISKGVRFLLVGFLVDANGTTTTTTTTSGTTVTTTTTTTTTGGKATTTSSSKTAGRSSTTTSANMATTGTA